MRPTSACSPTMTQFAIGDVTVDRIQEWDGWPAPASFFFPGADEQLWTEHRDLVQPDHYDPVSGLFRATMMAWLLRYDGRTVLVDAGVGNDKQRPNPAFHEQSSPFLDNLAAVGVQPEDVDFVVSTHLHVDHVGWFTRLVDDTWRPTFPNARYLLNAAELEFWDPVNRHVARDPGININVWGDSIAPVLAADHVDPWSDELHVDGVLGLHEAAGHTPGSAVIRVESGGEHGVFIGDLAHTPLQLAVPDLCTCFCEDAERSRAVRRSVFEQAADRNEMVFPGHFGASRALTLDRRGSAFGVDRWIDPQVPA